MCTCEFTFTCVYCDFSCSTGSKCKLFISIYEATWGGFPPQAPPLSYLYSAEWIRVPPKLHLNRNHPGQSEVSGRNLNIWICIFCMYLITDRRGQVFLALQEQFKTGSKMKNRQHTQQGMQTRGTSTNIHKLIVHVRACCRLENTPSEFLKYEITSTWHEVRSLHCPKQGWKKSRKCLLRHIRFRAWNTAMHLTVYANGACWLIHVSHATVYSTYMQLKNCQSL